MKNKKALALCSVLVLAVLCAFSPPGVTFSKQAHFFPATNETVSTASAALIDAGSGVFADDDSLPADDTAGLHFFPVHETTGMELHFAIDGTLAETATARIYRAFPITTGRFNATARGWTYRHLCDVSLVGSAQELGTFSQEIGAALRWTSVTVTSDAGLLPSGTRTMNGLTTNAAGSLVIDPLCAPYIIVQTRIGTCDGVAVFASDWTSN